jgi:hypothetical protein
VEFPAVSGTSYQIAVEGYSGEEGEIAVSLSLAPSAISMP